MSEAANPPVLVESAEGVAQVILNRPDRLNALDLEMRHALHGAFAGLAADPAVRAIVLAGNGRAFAAGADLKLLADKGPAQVRDLGFADLWRPIAECPKPIVAAVAGFALGAGCELAMMCDIIIAEEGARFGQPEVRVGVMPGAGGSQRLQRLVGKQVASLLLMTGEPIGGERAAQLGLASELAPPGEALARAKAVAARIATLPPLAMLAIKRTLASGADMPLATALALENREFLLLFDTADQKEGMAAFLDKRPPQFVGR